MNISQKRIERFLPFGWINKVFNFHLFEFATAKYEVTWADFVTKCLALLRKAKWQIWIQTIDNILIIREDALRGLWAEIAY